VSRLAAPVLAAAVVVLVVGCGGGTGADKAGGSRPVVLQMADGYDPSLELEPAVASFVQRVHELSHSSLRIRVVDDWAGNRPGFEQQIVRAVAADKADLAWVGTRVFDTLGVDSFQALTAPMLIDSYALEQAVIASNIPALMLKSLEPLGVSGLAVLGGGMRKPIAVRHPLLRPVEWHGIRFSVIRSRGQTLAIRALGAETTDVWGSGRQDAVAQHRVDGFEMHYYLWNFVIEPSVVPYVAANVNLWPETAALLMNPHRLSKLSDSQQRWLRQAAADAARRSTSLFENEQPIMTSLCRQGARFTNASPADLAALRQTFATVYAILGRDAQTKAYIARIEELKRNTRAERSPSIAPRCTGRLHTRPATAPARNDPAVLNGVYRLTLTDAELEAAGPPAAHSRPSFGGVITLTLRDGSYRFQPRTPPECTGTYAVSANTVRFRVHPASYCQGVVTARWSLAGAQLRLRVLSSTNPYDKVVWGAKPWKNIG
jgi:TRAP-type C4-dicarboxylate transport system substrate-binding protein